jgi:hypothetical protein
VVLFVTGQYAGAQYIHPLIKRWNKRGKADSPEYKLVATGGSCKYWDQHNIRYDQIMDRNISSVADYLNSINPNLLILSASGSENLEYLFILQAKKIGIKSANFIDTWSNYKNRFLYEGVEVYPDRILSINDKCSEEMIEDGIPEELIKIIGQPYLEEIVSTYLPLGDKILLPLQPVKKTRGDSLGYNETIFLKTTLDAIGRVGEINKVHVSLHPDSEISQLYNDSLIQYGEGDGYKDIESAYIIFGMFSMQMIVGFLCGRKVASIQPGLSADDPCPLSRWGLIPRLESVEEIVNFIKLPATHDHTSFLMRDIDGSLNRLEDFIKKNSSV